MALNPKKYIDKLIQALEKEGIFYVYTHKRFYSERTGRYCTKYIIYENGDKNSQIEVYNKLEILKYLVREYYKVTGKEIPIELQEAFDGE